MLRMIIFFPRKIIVFRRKREKFFPNSNRKVWNIHTPNSIYEYYYKNIDICVNKLHIKCVRFSLKSQANLSSHGNANNFHSRAIYYIYTLYNMYIVIF